MTHSTLDSPPSEKTRDADIRALVTAQLARSRPDVRVIHEWNIVACRIDVAALDPKLGTLHGYEIKSACDSFARLDRQIRSYMHAFDTLSIIVDRSKTLRTLSMAPDWCGVLEVRPTQRADGAPAYALVTVRPPHRNPHQSTTALLWLLWHRELRALMQRKCLDWRARRSKFLMVERLCRLPLDRVRRDVVAMLLARAEWKDLDGGRASSHWR